MFLFHKLRYKVVRNRNSNLFCHFLNNNVFPMKEKIKFRFGVCVRLRIHRYVAAPLPETNKDSNLMVEVHDKTAAFWQERMSYKHTVYSIQCAQLERVSDEKRWNPMTRYFSVPGSGSCVSRVERRGEDPIASLTKIIPLDEWYSFSRRCSLFHCEIEIVCEHRSINYMLFPPFPSFYLYLPEPEFVNV